MRYPRMDVEATRWPRSPQSKPSDLGKKRVILHSKQIFDPPFRRQGGLGWKKKVHQSTRTWILCPTWVFQIIRRRFRRAIEDSFREIKRCKYSTISGKRYGGRIEARHGSGPDRVTYNPFGMDIDCSIWDPFVPANEFLRVSMLFPNGLDVSLLVFDIFWTSVHWGLAPMPILSLY